MKQYPTQDSSTDSPTVTTRGLGTVATPRAPRHMAAQPIKAARHFNVVVPPRKVHSTKDVVWSTHSLQHAPRAVHYSLNSARSIAKPMFIGEFSLGEFLPEVHVDSLIDAAGGRHLRLGDWNYETHATAPLVDPAPQHGTGLNATGKIAAAAVVAALATTGISQMAFTNIATQNAAAETNVTHRSSGEVTRGVARTTETTVAPVVKATIAPTTLAPTTNAPTTALPTTAAPVKTTLAPTTTAPKAQPVAKPAAPAAIPSNYAGCSKSRQAARDCWMPLISQYGWDKEHAFNIMWCESTGNPNARNRYSTATGLFQILNGPTDPQANVALAYKMYSSRGWQPWVCKG